jgi:hypothetical protein
VRPLNDFDVDFVIGLHIQDAGHEYLTEVICLKRLEVGIEFSGHGEYLLVIAVLSTLLSTMSLG